LLKGSLTHPILMVRLTHLGDSITFSGLLQLQQLHGLVRQEGLTTVATTLSPMHLCLVSGTWISLEWHRPTTQRHTADSRLLAETTVYLTPLPLNQIQTTTGY